MNIKSNEKSRFDWACKYSAREKCLVAERLTMPKDQSHFKSPVIYLIAAFGLWLTGCSSTSPQSARPDFDAAQEIGFWKPYLLYLQAKPHPQLYVEVDAVAGSIPSQKTLDNLRHFLQTYCDKPAGIEIERSDVIPQRAAQGFSPEELACRYINGPPDNPSNPAPAFMYVLYYDDALADKSRREQGATKATADASHYREKKPHVDGLPYPAMIYVNTRYDFFFNLESVGERALNHEAGHLLGLVHRGTHASGYHCLDPDCLMAPDLDIHVARFALGLDPVKKQKELCTWCKDELAQDSKPVAVSNLYFVGPVLVRSESGYHVLSLPGHVEVFASSLDKKVCQEFAAEARKEAVMEIDGGTHLKARLTVTGDDDILRKPGKMVELITQIASDPYELVRNHASGDMAQCGVEYYLAQRQFTDAVDLCRAAIRLNIQGSEIYNSLARIKCTCPDASVRDAKEALAAAAKACELSAWKDCRTIDTLAAAYAESGDFSRAIEFEERALRTGPPGEADQKELHDRLALYKKSRPFRSTL